MVTAQPLDSVRDAQAWPGHSLLLAAWLGLAVGLAEAGYMLTRQHLFGRLNAHLSPQVIWMSPVADLLWFLPLGLLLLGIHRLRPSALSAVATLTLTFMPAYLALGFLFPSFHRGAATLLAFGLALQTARLLRDRRAVVIRVVWRTLPVLAGVIGFGVAANALLDARREAAARRQVPFVGTDSTNVLLLVLDTVRALDLSLYGYDRPTTPGLTRWARSGTVFSRAYSTAPWTLPSHASMFTGRLPHELSVGWAAALDETYPTLAEVLRARGYRTGGFIANMLFCGRDFGLGRGFDHYEDFAVSPGEVFESSSIGRVVSESYSVRRLLGHYDYFGRKAAPTVDGPALRWMTADRSRPFFAFVNLLDAHQPYLPPAEDDARFVTQPTPRRQEYRYLAHEASLRNPELLSTAELQREREAYDASIAYLDRRVDSLLGALAREGILDRTLVIVTADHGEQFGEHGFFAHGNSVYGQTLWVPLILRLPGRVPAGRVVETPVSLRDLPATVLELTGVPKQRLFPGQSWAARWRSADAGAMAPPVAAEVRLRGRTDRALILGDEHYLSFHEGGAAVYNIRTDPTQQHDLLAAGATAHPGAYYAARLDSLIPVARTPGTRSTGAR
ncbi:MAG: sulfatase [Gemmatimonadales bacterium]